ncbi:hypothetical protein LMG22037_00083 [Paraburkholderia phenoliruptrix]|uniref:Uncharacterized protein n=1 Tax=Paraburkholderia phenoliruptrix TaxID=252970 RepID=A0A6J4ZNT7_9BURK|nr:hypothetical protein [Paraburkholderia phenoliruptrix]CAB3638628.1 hypothetical protein LMG22037_00083 [Paraburkholderia phenoliruptrix]
MEDALERRALLLHLGRVLQLIARLNEAAVSATNVEEVIGQNPILEEELLLAHLLPDLPLDEFRARALHAFCLWPQWLLEDPLDRGALSASVHDHLFKDNPQGWRAYVAGLRRDVAWFGIQPAKPGRASRRARAAPLPLDDAPAPAPAAAEPATRRTARDVERDLGAASEGIESVEGARPRNEGRADEQRVAQWG